MLACSMIMSLGVLVAQPRAAQAADRVVKSFASGSGIDAVGTMYADSGEDKDEDGPQAIATGDDGRVFLLDQMNHRILAFNPATPTVAPQSLALPPDVLPTDLVVRGNDIFVWDGKIHALQALGSADAPTRGLTETRSVEPVEEATQTAFAQMGSAPTDVDVPGEETRGVKINKRNDLARQAVATRGRGTVVVDVKLTAAGDAATLEVRGKDKAGAVTKLNLRVRDRLGTVAFLDIDQSGQMFVLAENIPVNINDSAFAFVARYSPAGVLEGVYEVPLSATNISRRCVTISPEGDVYFLKSHKDAVEIIGLGFRSTPSAKLVEFSRYKPNVAALAWIDTKGINMAVGPLSRQKIIQSALAYEAVQWTVTPQAYGSNNQPCTGFAGRIRVPMYLVGKEGQTVRGVPYCWGCQGSVRQFVDRVQHGVLAGNVCTKDGIRPDTAGVDCSSFVSATWGLSTHFTTAVIPAIASRVTNPWDMQPGDAFDKPGSHVMLFMGFTPNREVQVMEASTGGCGGKVCRNVYPLTWLLSRGYLPVRYKALVEGDAPTAVTPAKGPAQPGAED